MKIVSIPKGGGKFRTIYVPDASEMATLRAMLPELETIQSERDKNGVCHAFFKGRSPLTNAMQHRGFAYTLKFDLKDFFDTVTREVYLVWKDLSAPRWDVCFPDGAARQGLPTSPLIANIAASKLDGELLSMRGREGRFENRFVYTRYADDMTFSFDDPRLIFVLKSRVPEIVARHGFELNASKTRLQSAKVGRRKITGYSVDDEVHATRETKRRLRAAEHRGRPSQVAGLKEWCRLRLPRAWQQPAEAVSSVGSASTARPVAKARQNSSSAPRGTVLTLFRDAVSTTKRAFSLKPEKAWYFSFGQAHVHTMRGVTYDKDCVVRIWAENEDAARDTMFSVFGPRWSMQYAEGDLKLDHFPRGIVELTR